MEIIKVFLSHNMSGLEESEVTKIREEAMNLITKKFPKNLIHFIDNYHHNDAPENAGRLWHLGRSIQQLEDADFVYYINKYSDSNGCAIEKEIIGRYDIPTLNSTLDYDATDNTYIIYKIEIPEDDIDNYIKYINAATILKKPFMFYIAKEYDYPKINNEYTLDNLFSFLQTVNARKDRIHNDLKNKRQSKYYNNVKIDVSSDESTSLDNIMLYDYVGAITGDPTNNKCSKEEFVKYVDELKYLKDLHNIPIITCLKERELYKPKSVKLFTHTDLDGVSCAILAKLVFGCDNVNVSYVTHNNVNDEVRNYLSSEDSSKDDIMFITDISVDEETAKLIDENLQRIKCVLLDHHKTAEWLNDKHTWATVCINNPETNVLTSGTELFYIYILSQEYIRSTKYTDEFVDIVKRYDTWLWKTDYKDGKEVDMNTLLHLLGRAEFVDNMCYKLKESLPLYDEFDIMLLDIENTSKEKYITNMIDKKSYNINIIGNHKVATTFGVRYLSELGNRLLESLGGAVDYYMNIDLTYKTVELRSIGDFDVSVIAKNNGGGGHKNAAGFPLTDTFVKCVSNLFISLFNV